MDNDRHGDINFKSLDWWSVGCILYEILIGSHAFAGKTKSQVFNNVKKRDLIFPEIGYDTETQISPESHNLIEQFLHVVPSSRMGLDFNKLKIHPFFKNVDWNLVENLKSPIKDLIVVPPMEQLKNLKPFIPKFY